MPKLPPASIWIAAALLASAAACGRGRNPFHDYDPDTVSEAYRHSTAALAWPGATRAFQITAAGDLWNGAWRVRTVASAGGALAEPPRAIAFEDRWRPVARWNRVGGAVRWEFEAVALPESDPADWVGARNHDGAAADSGLLVSLQIRAINRGASAVDARLALSFSGLEAADAFVAFDAEPAAVARWAGGRGDEPATGWTSAPTRGDTTVMEFSLPAGGRRTERVVLSAYPLSAQRLSAWARAPHLARVEQSRNYWESEIRGAAKIDVDDPEVENALRAALVVLLTSRERRGGDWVPTGGPLHYRDVWIRDGARSIQALALMGRTGEARRLAAGLLRFQWPHGAFMSQRGQLDGTGQALWALDQAWMRPSPPDTLSAFAEAALRAVRWCERQRALGRDSGWPLGALLPYADPRDNEQVATQLVGNDAWAIAGYRAAARLNRAAGRRDLADSIEAARATYRRDFIAALATHEDVPAGWETPARDWGNLAVAYPCGVLPASDPRCAALASRIWAISGGAGLASSPVPDSLHGYLGADLGTWALLAGRRAAADSVIDAMLAWRSASGGAAEVFSVATRDYGVNPPPHPTAAAALITLIRNCMVFDEDDTLRLTLGARERWWRNGRLEKAPTRFGLLDLTFRRSATEAQWQWSAVPVWSALTLPPGTVLDGPLAPPLEATSDGTRVLAPPGTTAARVPIAPARQAQ